MKCASISASPVFAEPLHVAEQIRVVRHPAFVFRQLDRAHRVVVQALALVGELLRDVRDVRHVLLQRANVVLGTEPSARAGMAGNQSIPRTPPSSSVRRSSTTSSGSTTFDCFSSASFAFALRCAMNVAPASLKGLPPVMWS